MRLLTRFVQWLERVGGYRVRFRCCMCGRANYWTYRDEWQFICWNDPPRKRECPACGVVSVQSVVKQGS